MSDDHLLPSNASDLEVSLDQAAARIGDVAVPIRDLGDPQRTPADVLPWLAWAWSIDVWDATWSAAQKRAVIAGAFALHRRKGTLDGVRRIIRLFGGAFVGATVPPAATHLGASWSQDARARFLSRYPELRVYPRRDRGARMGAALGRAGAPRTYLTARPADTPVRADAAARYAPQVVRIDPDGTETVLTTQSWDVQRQAYREITATFSRTVVRGRAAMLSGEGVAAMHLGGVYAFPADTQAARAIYAATFTDRTRVTGARPEVDIVPAGLAPMAVQSDLRALDAPVRGAMLGAAWLGGGVPGNAHLSDQRAGERMFRSTRLFDPDVTVAAQGPVAAHLGAARLGMPAHTAEIRTTFRARRTRSAAGRFVAGHLIAAPMARPDALRRVLAATVSARDRVYLDTATKAPVAAGPAHRAGSVTAGEWTRK